MSDFFSDLAAGGISYEREALEEQKPVPFVKKPCKLEKISGCAGEKHLPQIQPKMSTAEELQEELKRMREQYAPFRQNFAPEAESYTQRVVLKNFTVDGESVSLPHYGGPCGYAKKVYETTFEIAQKQRDKAYYVCLKGADYKAVVYLNGECVGIHEGFFEPFEFAVEEQVRSGRNELKIELYNDYIYMGEVYEGCPDRIEGDKMYAATGLGWDDPEIGWHHCPPGMGLYGEVALEIRNRVSISDVFVRNREVWVEVLNADYTRKEISFLLSVYGQNFQETVVEDFAYVPTKPDIRDLSQKVTLLASKGINVYKIPCEIKNPRNWTPDTPWLYQMQVSILENGTLMDKRAGQFGVRSFTQDTEHTPKGMFYLNGEKIRLRGANTMGFEQQDVLKGDFEQLIDDILLAKICNMNFWRLTQRPVQEEVYTYCDRLGLMTQTDLPLFGCMRRTKLAEGIRQAEAMEKLVRSHPCNVLISYMNEPFTDVRNQPQRHFIREELEQFFTCCDTAVRLQNPDRVIKHIDGDYDPPCKSMPDNHCYTMWYNGHGIEAGLLHKGYWLPVKAGWYYGCGEFGAEGLEDAGLMRETYPEEWLKEPFHPQNIRCAQTGKFYHYFYDKGDSPEEWVANSQEYQAFATGFMIESFRRNPRMISTAIHLFIDAWPSGWMKTIMDCRRNPKEAYFACRNAYEPVHVSLRTDRFAYFEGETVSIECYICNDTNLQGDYTVVYEMEDLIAECKVYVDACTVTYVSNAEFEIETVQERKEVLLKAALLDDDGKVIGYGTQEVTVFPRAEVAKETENELIFDLEPGEYEIAGEKVVVTPSYAVHFVSRKTGHKAVEKFGAKDFSWWYNEEKDRISPIARKVFRAEGFQPILLSGSTRDGKEAMVCGEKLFCGKRYIICTAELREENPAAKLFLHALKKL